MEVQSMPHRQQDKQKVMIDSDDDADDNREKKML